MAHRLVLNQSEIKRFRDQFADELVSGVLNRVEADALRRIPRKTGVTAATKFRTINYGAETVGTLGFRSPVAFWLHEGTPPHREPVSGYTQMTFYWEKVGHVVSFPSVNHPGIQPNRFLTEPLAIEANRMGFMVVLTASG